MPMPISATVACFDYISTKRIKINCAIFINIIQTCMALHFVCSYPSSSVGVYFSFIHFLARVLAFSLLIYIFCHIFHLCCCRCRFVGSMLLLSFIFRHTILSNNIFNHQLTNGNRSFFLCVWFCAGDGGITLFMGGKWMCKRAFYSIMFAQKRTYTDDSTSIAKQREKGDFFPCTVA